MRRRVLVVAVVAAFAAAAAASVAGTTSAAPSRLNAAPSPPSSVLNLIPKSLRSSYAGAALFVDVTASPLASWKPRATKPPYSFCFSQSYTGNDWRSGLDGELTKLVNQMREQHFATGPLKMTNSNNDLNVQLSNINGFIQQGCDVIFVMPGSSTGLCSAINRAFDSGTLLVTMGSEANCRGIINSDFNQYIAGYDTAYAVGKQMGGKGNAVLVNSIPGEAVTAARRQGAIDGLKAASSGHIKVVGEVSGNWTPSIAKTQMLEWLSTHPGQKVDGVWQSGLMEEGIYEAFKQTGRPAPKIGDLGGDCAELAFWHDTGLASFSLHDDGVTQGYQALLTSVRILDGAKPLVNTLFFTPPHITPANFTSWYRPNMTVQSVCYGPIPSAYRVPDSAEAPLMTNVPKNLGVKLSF